MVETPSAMLDLGTQLPAFSLPSVMGGNWDQVSLMGQHGLLVAFVCNHCPYVIHIMDRLVQLANEWVEAGLGVAFISANDANTYPQDGPEPMLALAQKKGFGFQYLYDESQTVAKAFKATCTPDFFLFNHSGQLAYRGQFDGARPGNAMPVTGKDLSEAVKRLFEGEKPDPNQVPSVGCNIKWK